MKKITIEFTERPDGQIGITTSGEGFSSIEIIGMIEIAKVKVFNTQENKTKKKLK